MIDSKKKELDFNNLEKYKAALDDGFTWGNAKLNSPTTTLTLLKNENEKYVLATVNFIVRESETIVSEKDFKIFCEKVKLFFSKNIN
ncbi:hypothetical protein [Cetobacterium sp.]|uniref:hypothetical protein n=1 Tax=Cetobacterium sp. TaxID=2071632 RepID=UPI003EE6B207